MIKKIKIKIKRFKAEEKNKTRDAFVLFNLFVK